MRWVKLYYCRPFTVFSVASTRTYATYAHHHTLDDLMVTSTLLLSDAVTLASQQYEWKRQRSNEVWMC